MKRFVAAPRNFATSVSVKFAGHRLNKIWDRAIFRDDFDPWQVETAPDRARRDSDQVLA